MFVSQARRCLYISPKETLYSYIASLIMCLFKLERTVSLFWWCVEPRAVWIRVLCTRGEVDVMEGKCCALCAMYDVLCAANCVLCSFVLILTTVLLSTVNLQYAVYCVLCTATYCSATYRARACSSPPKGLSGGRLSLSSSVLDGALRPSRSAPWTLRIYLSLSISLYSVYKHICIYIYIYIYTYIDVSIYLSIYSCSGPDGTLRPGRSARWHSTVSHSEPLSPME